MASSSSSSSDPSPEKNVSIRKTRSVSSLCRVCGAPAVYSYFGAITCHSCKMFFKRNAESGLVRPFISLLCLNRSFFSSQSTFRCDFQGQCSVTILNRHVCTACRLAKCFSVGMRTESIRCSRQRRNNPVVSIQASESRRREVIVDRCVLSRIV